MAQNEEKKEESRNVSCYGALWLRILFTIGVLVQVAGVVDGVLDRRWLSTSAFFIMGLFFAWLAWSYWKNPIIEMSDSALQVHAPFEYARSTVSIPWEEMAGIVWHNPKTICVRLRGGETHTLYLSQLGCADRELVHREVMEKVAPGNSARRTAQISRSAE